MQRVLIIKDDSNSFEQFYNRKFEELGCQILTKNKFYRSQTRGIKRKINTYISVKRYKRQGDFDTCDTIIVFEDIYIALFLSLLTKKRIILWYWNTLEDAENSIKFAKKFCEVWTFDKGDSEKYSIHLNTQFYTGVDFKKNNSSVKSAFFVGKDKGRAETLFQLALKLEKLGVVCDFHIIPDEGKAYSQEVSMYIDNSFLEYDEVLQHINNNTIIIDLAKPNQVGMTVRALEAMVYGKKLITNNKFIDIENPNSILVLEKADTEAFVKFVGSSFCPYEDTDFYSITNWLKRFEI